MSLDFSDFEEDDEITIKYTVYSTMGSQTETKTTVVSTSVAGINRSGNLEWRAGSTGTGVVRENGHVFDGKGTKIGVDATVEHIED